MDLIYNLIGPLAVAFLGGVVVGHSIREDDTVPNPFEVAGGDER